MPNVEPPPNTVERLDAMIELYSEKAVVDWNINAAGTVRTEIAGLADARDRAPSRCSWSSTRAATTRTCRASASTTTASCCAIFETRRRDRPAAHGPPARPGADGLTSRSELLGPRRARRRRRYAQAYAAHDGIIWDTAAALLLRLQQADRDAALHLLHTQTAGVDRAVRRAKARGQDVTAEINPWAALPRQRLGEHRAARVRTRCPTTCPETNTEPLWEALADGTIDLISTDHAPHTREEKEPGWTDGWRAHTGTPSAQFYVPLFLDAARAGRISLERVVELDRDRPGAGASASATKGRLEVGCDADIAIVDLDAEFEITRRRRPRARSAGRRTTAASPRASIETTLVRGRVVYADGTVVGDRAGARRDRAARPPPPVAAVARRSDA